MDHAIVDKVIKLLALADDKGATDGEKEAAKAMAVKLMAKYQISMAQAHTSAPHDQRLFAKLEVETGLTSFDTADTKLITVVCRFSQVCVIRATNPTRYIFVGKDSDIESALYMADILIRQRDEKNPHRRATQIKEFNYSFACGVEVKLQELSKRAQEAVVERGLVPVKLEDQALAWYNQFISNTTKTSSKRPGFDAEGFAAGKSAQIHHGIGNGNAPAQPHRLN